MATRTQWQHLLEGAALSACTPSAAGTRTPAGREARAGSCYADRVSGPVPPPRTNRASPGLEAQLLLLQKHHSLQRLPSTPETPTPAPVELPATHVTLCETRCVLTVSLLFLFRTAFPQRPPKQSHYPAPAQAPALASQPSDGYLAHTVTQQPAHQPAAPATRHRWTSHGPRRRLHANSMPRTDASQGSLSHSPTPLRLEEPSVPMIVPVCPCC